MPFIYLYSPTDFVSLPPPEDASTGSVAGTGPWTLTLKPDAKPTVVEVNDANPFDPTVFNEIEPGVTYSQQIANDIDLDGTTYSAGTSITTSYDLLNTSTNHKITSVHFSNDGYTVGAVDGIASSIKLTPGQSYTFDLARSSADQNNLYADYAACFTRGTRIATPAGQRPIEALVPGDLILRPDGTAVALRLLAHRRVGRAEQERAVGLRPVRIAAGALGAGLPHRPLKVSRQHRMVVPAPDGSSVLAAAIRLCDLPGIRVVESCRPVDYYHLIFDTHEIVLADGSPSESFLVTPTSLYGVAPETRRQISALYPDFVTGHREQAPALPIPGRKAQKSLVRQLRKSGPHAPKQTDAPLAHAG